MRVTVTEDREALGAHDGRPLVLGRYRLGTRLGAGGFGSVHEAFDERLERWVAVKVIPSESAAPERARREARAAAGLDHPGIVALHDAGEDAHARYLVCELVEGPTMAALERAGALTDRDVLRIGLALCDALEHAHGRGVVHRDVKPHNVLVPEDPPSWRAAAKLTDFGVALLAGDDPLTRTGDVVGTLAYMAPEQAAGGGLDERVDLYATALVLYEALAGHNPVRGATPAETARKVGRPVASLRRARPDLPEELVVAIDAALRADPDQRGTLEDLADALEQALVDLPSDDGAIVEHPVERPRLLAPVPRGAPRIAHALATGAVVAGALTALGPSARVPWIAAAAAAALVAALPRAGWLLAIAATALALVAGPAALDAEDGVSAAGSALLLLAAAAPVPFLLARAPRAWSAAVLAPLLGAVGLATAYPALAARAPRVLERAALGALGAWWLLLAEPLADRTLLLGPAAGAATGASAQEAVSIAAQALSDTVTAGLPLLLAVWALAAAVLPWVVRGRTLAMDAAAATGWAAGLVAATAAAGAWIGERSAAQEPRGLLAGALLAAVLAVHGAHARHARYLPHDSDE